RRRLWSAAPAATAFIVAVVVGRRGVAATEPACRADELARERKRQRAEQHPAGREHGAGGGVAGDTGRQQHSAHPDPRLPRWGRTEVGKRGGAEQERREHELRRETHGKHVPASEKRRNRTGHEPSSALSRRDDPSSWNGPPRRDTGVYRDVGAELRGSADLNAKESLSNDGTLTSGIACGTDACGCAIASRRWWTPQQES